MSLIFEENYYSSKHFHFHPNTRVEKLLPYPNTGYVIGFAGQSTLRKLGSLATRLENGKIEETLGKTAI